MNPTAYLWMLKFGGLTVVLGVIFAAGYRTAESNLQPVINERNAQLLAIDLKAQSDTATYERNLNAIQTKAKSDNAAVGTYYSRLLYAKNNPSPSQTPNNTPAVDSGCSQQTISGCSVETEQRCVSDAMRVQEIATFFKVNNFPQTE